MPDEVVLKKIRDMSSEEKEQLIKKIEETAFENSEVYRGCALCVLDALLTNLDIGDSTTVKAVLKAAIPISGGSRSGGQCGALSAGLIAVALVYGPDELDEWDPYKIDPSSAYEHVLRRAETLCRKFRNECGIPDQYGGLSCPEVQQALLGTVYDLRIPEVPHFHEHNVRLGHPSLRIAARTAAQVILALASEFELRTNEE